MRTPEEKRFLDQLITISVNTEIARQKYLDGDLVGVDQAILAISIGAKNLETDFEAAKESAS